MLRITTRARVELRAAAVLGAIVVMASGCGSGGRSSGPAIDAGGNADGAIPPPPVERCWPDTCDGCCQGGTCVGGTQNSACGAGGAACTACATDDERCAAGVCVAVPCAERCDGCCSGDVCLGGTSATACGTGGAECAGCASNQECRSGDCHLSATSRWDVLLVRATVPEHNTGGGSWDPFGGLPDPKVKVRANDGSTSYEESSDSRDDTLSPSWSVVMLESVPWRALSSGIGVEVNDADLAGDDFMGSCWHTPSESDAAASSVAIRCPRDADASPPQSGVTVTLRLRPH